MIMRVTHQNLFQRAQIRVCDPNSLKGSFSIYSEITEENSGETRSVSARSPDRVIETDANIAARWNKSHEGIHSTAIVLIPQYARECVYDRDCDFMRSTHMNKSSGIGDLLIHAGLIDSPALERILNVQSTNGGSLAGC